MLDINFIRNNVSVVKKAVSDKRMETDIDRLLQVDSEIRNATAVMDALRAERNSLSKQTLLLQGNDKNAAIERAKP